jgi:hypothetical protein
LPWPPQRRWPSSWPQPPPQWPWHEIYCL